MTDADFTPRMPDVEFPPEGLIPYAWDLAAEKEPRHVVIVTPERSIKTSKPLPPREALPPERIEQLEAIAPAKEPWRVAAVGMTALDAFLTDPHRAVPFLGLLEGLAQLGHAVVVFEGHPSVFEAIVRDVDLLIVDGEMIPYLEAEWLDIALAAARKPNILKVIRSGAEIQGVQRFSRAGE